MDAFRDAYPDRFFQAGIAEANMMGVAAGLTIGGKIPFTGTFANFSTGRVYDQIRQSIAYSGKNVKICASHAGLTLGEDGATHQILEDIGDANVACNDGDSSLRLQPDKAATWLLPNWTGRSICDSDAPKCPTSRPPMQLLRLASAALCTGSDVTIVATGHLVWKALEAAEALDKEGISAEVINVHTIKPLDEDALLASIIKTGCVVSAEEHQRYGGLGERIAQMLSTRHPAPQEFVAVNDSFGESGKPEELLEKYGLSATHIGQAVHRVLKRK